MSDPKQEELQERDELDLEAETVQDLEPDESNAEEVVGGICGPQVHSTLQQG